MNREELQTRFANALILAPLTKGGNLPYRRLCVEYGADITLSEMAYARFLLKGEARERALIRRHESERCFGVQVAALQPEEALLAGKMIQDSGADFIDINCGCPIDDVTRKGLGAALLRRPKALFRLVEHLAQNLEIPVTVKIRTGFKEGEINAQEIARGVEEAGAAVLTVHGRTREQRYSRAADWSLIGEIRELLSIPVIGNGDVLTHYEADTRRKVSGVSSVMIGRGALIKPWIFQELKEGKELCLSTLQRLEVYWKFVQYMKEHFRDDDKGRRRIMGFLPWHFSFFSRYEPLPAESFAALADGHPLIQSRRSFRDESSTALDRLIDSTDKRDHQRIAQALVDAGEFSDFMAVIEGFECAARVDAAEVRGGEGDEASFQG